MPGTINALISDAILGNADVNFFRRVGISGVADFSFIHPTAFKCHEMSQYTCIYIHRSILISAFAERIFQIVHKAVCPSSTARLSPGAPLDNEIPRGPEIES